MRITPIISLVIIAILFAAGTFLYGSMPESMASHWDINGNANGAMPRAWGVFLLPTLALVIYLLLEFIPRIDPLWKNIKGFRKQYDRFILLFMLFFSYIYALTLAWNLGVSFNMTVWFLPAFGVLFLFLGDMLRHVTMNWTIGIRTPWALSDDRVWRATHDFGGKLFMIAGALCFVGMLFPRLAFWFVIIPILLAALGSAVYSYVVYRKLNIKPKKR
jgi:uncharacterized membrane protein